MNLGRAEVYEWRGRYFCTKDDEVFEMTDAGMVRLCDNVTDADQTVLVYRPRMWFSNEVGLRERPAA